MGHWLVYLSQGPPWASRLTPPAFTPMKDELVLAPALYAPGGHPHPSPDAPPGCPGCRVSWPSCAADQPVVLTHFPAPFVTLESTGNSFISHESHFLLPGCCVIIMGLPAPSCSGPHLNIPLWNHNTSNMPQDTIHAGQRRCSHVPLHERNCCRLPSLTWHANVFLHDKL